MCSTNWVAKDNEGSDQSGLTVGNRMKVVVAIPCFNTECAITDVVSKAREYVDEVVVVDDGSDDHTSEAARSAGALLVSHGSNAGYGKAIKSCFEAAKARSADVLVILDGDGQHNPHQIPLLVAPILKEGVDLVIGSRFLRQTAPTQSTDADDENSMPSYRAFGIKVITYLWDFGSRTKVSDAQSGFRAYSKKLFEELLLSEQGMSISIEILEKVRRKGATIKEVPISCYYPALTVKSRAVKHGLGVALSVIRIRLKHIVQGLLKRDNASGGAL